MDADQVRLTIEAVKAWAPIVEAARQQPLIPANRTATFDVVQIDLSAPAADKNQSLLTAKGGMELGMAGCGLMFLRRGSHPGGLLTVHCGGDVQTFGPGDRILTGGQFENMRIERAPGSARSGTVYLLVLKRPGVDMTEAAEIAQTLPVALIGTFDANGNPTTYVPVTEDTDPSGTGFAALAAIDISGWRTIEVFMDGQSAAGNATSWELVPFVDPGYQGAWHEQGVMRQGIPDSDASGFRFRHFILNVSGRGMLAFAVRNLQAAARTSVGFAMRGVA